MEISVKRTIAGRELVITTGKIAKLAEGSCTVRFGDTLVLSTVCSSENVREGLDYFPLTVEYRERFYAAGKIPGGFFKREGRPRELETLNARITDRSMRPLFPSNLLNEVQIINTVLSYDTENEADVLALIGSSTSVLSANIPYHGPVAPVKIGKIAGNMVLFPTMTDLKSSSMELLVVYMKAGVIMIECGSKEVTETEVLEAIKFGRKTADELIAMQEEVSSKVEKPNKTFTYRTVTPDLEKQVKESAGDKLVSVEKSGDKKQRASAIKKIREEVKAALLVKFPLAKNEINGYLDNLESDNLRKQIVEGKVRPDGRGMTDIRPITCEVGYLPRTHGSAIFSRGQTQALVVTTLGTKDDIQYLDDLSGEAEKKYMLHYNFPPFATGEAKPIRGVGRREVGHGALAEKALAPVIPSQEKFPYVINLVSDIIESNGSSSMASVCGATLSLMDAGVPISSPVAGISIGLIKEENGWVTITDIAGIEDHFGDMDFKIAGTAKGITAIQLDMKVEGISDEIIEKTLSQAKEARMLILEKITAAISNPRSELSSFAPRIVTFKVHQDKIKIIIGPSGKMIKKIVEETGASINIDDDGTVHVASADSAALEAAVNRIKEIAREAEMGATYTGKVKKVAEFGAFVEIFPGQDGLVHISELDIARVKRVEDVCREGDTMTVKVIGIDEKTGKIKLSKKALMSAPGGTTGS